MKCKKAVKDITYKDFLPKSKVGKLDKLMKNKIFMIPRNHEYIRRLCKELMKMGVEVKVLKPFHYSSLTNITKMLYFKLLGYRIIHVHWLYIFPMRLFMKVFYYYCKLIGIKIIWEMHNILPHNYSNADKINCKWFYEKVDGIIFHSESDIGRVRQILETTTQKNNIVIPHGNFNESYENKISKMEAKRILKISGNIKMILCFGFIRRNRGYEYLVEAIKDIDDICLVIAGKLEVNI